MINKLLTLLICAVGWMASASTAWAALPDKPGEIRVESSPVLSYTITLLLIAGMAAASLKSSKRTHLD